MTRSDILSLDFTGKTVVIIGNPATGKTTLATMLAAQTGSRLFHADDYMSHGYKQSLYALLDDVVEADKPLIVDGVQCYRLLRKGVQLGNFYPDIVIELTATEEQVERVYRNERPGKDTKFLAGFNKMHQTILNGYRELDNPHPPTWYTVENEF